MYKITQQDDNTSWLHQRFYMKNTSPPPGFEPLTFRLTSSWQEFASLQSISLTQLVTSTLWDLVDNTKTAVLTSGGITQRLLIQLSKCSAASLTALIYQDHLCFQSYFFQVEQFFCFFASFVFLRLPNKGGGGHKIFPMSDNPGWNSRSWHCNGCCCWCCCCFSCCYSC